MWSIKAAAGRAKPSPSARPARPEWWRVLPKLGAFWLATRTRLPTYPHARMRGSLSPRRLLTAAITRAIQRRAEAVAAHAATQGCPPEFVCVIRPYSLPRTSPACTCSHTIAKMAPPWFAHYKHQCLILRGCSRGAPSNRATHRPRTSNDHPQAPVFFVVESSTSFYCHPQSHPGAAPAGAALIPSEPPPY